MKKTSKSFLPNVDSAVQAIAPHNNRYRESNVSVQLKLEALWEIGNVLVGMGVTKPHSFGWAVQKQTRGLIKRPTVFRSHKIRSIWPSKEKMASDLRGLRNLSYLTEILPLIDPAQKVRKKLSEDAIGDIYGHAAIDSPPKFRLYVANLKKEFSYGRLGKKLDRSKHLNELQEVIVEFRSLSKELLKILSQESADSRKKFRAETVSDELRSLANMCLALTTKDNVRLYKRLGPDDSSSENKQLRMLYRYFRTVLDRKNDVERARLRRVIAPEALAQMSDALSSIGSEEGVQDFRTRQKMAIPL